MLKELEVPCSIRLILQLFKTWNDDGKTSGEQGSIDFHTYSKDLLSVRVNRPWSLIRGSLSI